MTPCDVSPQPLGGLLGGTSCDVSPPPAVPAGSSLCTSAPQHLRAAAAVTGRGWVPRTAAPHSPPWLAEGQTGKGATRRYAPLERLGTLEWLQGIEGNKRLLDI